jgi:hypothetical protein
MHAGLKMPSGSIPYADAFGKAANYTTLQAYQAVLDDLYEAHHDGVLLTYPLDKTTLPYLSCDIQILKTRTLHLTSSPAWIHVLP